MQTRSLLAILLLASFASCSTAATTTEDSTAPAAPGATAGSSTGDLGSPATAPAVSDANPFKAPSGEGEGLSGKVLEAIDAGSYTYLRLDTAGSETWAAVPKAEVGAGQIVTIGSPMPMDGFESPTLNRKFDRIVFGSLAMGAPSAASGNPHMAAPKVDAGDVSVAKAEGPDGRTVAAVHAEKKTLAGKTIAVHGKVVKAVKGVMGKNFIHVRDGSGTEAAGDHDLTVTTTDDANVGDVVLARGTVIVDRDLGSGYAYAVIIEDATLTK